MKPFDGGGWRGVSQVKNVDDLHSAYDDSGEMLMHLQASVKDFEVFARALTIGPETMVMKFQPDEPMHNRYAVEHGFLVRRRGHRGGHHRPDGERVLPVGVQLLRDARQGRRRLPDRLRERLPRRGGHVAALLLPVGDEGPAQVVGVLRGHRPQGAHPGRHRTRGSTVADDADLDYGGKLGRPTRGSPTPTSTPTATASSARRPCRTSTTWCWSGSTRPTSAACSPTRSRRPIPSTSGTSSRATSAA